MAEKKCKFTDCPNAATDYVEYNQPNNATENWDRVNPIRVDVCAEHLRVMQGMDLAASDFSIGPKETHG